MAVDSYTALKDFVTAHLELDAATVAQLPNLIQLAEVELDHMLVTPWGEKVAYTTTIAATQTVALPADFQQMRTVIVDDDYPLEAITLNTLHSQYADSGVGKPRVYAVANQSLYLGPIPDGVYTITATYDGALTPLSATNATNWLLTRHPDAYVYATLAQTEAFLTNDERAARMMAKLDQIVGRINKSAVSYRYSTPMRLRSPVVC